MPTRPLQTMLVAALAAVLLGGCSSRYLVDESIPIDLRGAVTIDLESFGGDVTVVVDPEIERPRVSLVRESTHGYGRADEAAAALGQIELRTDVRGGGAGQVLRIEAVTTHVEPHFQLAHLEVLLREVDGLTVSTARGDVVALGVAGAIDVRTGLGDVRIATEMPVHVPVRVSSDDGDVEVRIRGESSGVLDFHSTGGIVRHRIRYGRTIVHPGTDHQTLHATYNGGENPITLRARDGDVVFVVDDDPMDFAASIF